MRILILIVVILLQFRVVNSVEWEYEYQKKELPKDLVEIQVFPEEVFLTKKEDIKAYARLKVSSDKEWKCLDKLIIRESNWDTYADNTNSSAYGIFQALPGKKMESEWEDWKDNPKTQIEWGMKYVKSQYKTPCNALNHSYQYNWY